jgi:hypothetical protein
MHYGHSQSDNLCIIYKVDFIHHVNYCMVQSVYARIIQEENV